MKRATFVLLMYVAAVVSAAAFCHTSSAAIPDSQPPHIAPETPADAQPLVVVRQPEVAVLASRVAYWKRKAAAARARARALHRELLHQPSVSEALAIASTAYGVSYWSLRRRAYCESRLNPYARNASSATGLFQILYPSTWRTTPFGFLSPYSAYANAMAAAYMLAHGRGGEWVCGG